MAGRKAEHEERLRTLGKIYNALLHGKNDHEANNLTMAIRSECGSLEDFVRVSIYAMEENFKEMKQIEDEVITMKIQLGLKHGLNNGSEAP
jgi:hypothetical protein